MERTGPPDYFSVSLPLHEPLSLFNFVSLDPVWAKKISDWNAVLATSDGHSQILCCLSLCC